jgi:asparagine synthase (glutamine-hydrolysing)
MCGIAGILSFKKELTPSHLQRLELALQQQTHRGPDAKSIWTSSRVGLGHNRLSIIDLTSSANQPFFKEDLGLTIVFNGEIYNYLSLKKELELLGYHFTTTSDTEVLLAAFRHYGKDVCTYLVGMFAFVIYDHQNQTLFAARDRFGEKPFFYIHNNEEFLFASELGPLRELYSNELTINHSAVVDLMENMFINPQHSIYNEVSIFPAASYMVIDGSDVNFSTYYSFPKKATSSIGFSALKTQVKSLLFEIVDQELHADVPVATFLSSGVDSSVISAIAKEINPDILAVTMSTGDPASDETAEAKEFAQKLNIRQEIVQVNPGALSVLAKLFRSIQPLADASLIPTHLVTEAVSMHTKVMLSGDAGDEVFGSYNKPNLYQSFGSHPILGGDFGLNALLNLPPKKIGKYLSDKNRFRLAGWKGYYKKNNLSGCFKDVFKSGLPLNYVSTVAEELMSAYQENPEKLSFGVDLLTRLPGDFLFKVDSAAMRSSLEVRAPFLDHRLVDLSLESDLNSLMPNKTDKEITKSIYHDFAGYAHRGSKKGFSIPYLNYLQNSWGNILEDFLKENLSEVYFHFNSKGLLKILNQHREKPQQSLARILFSALVLEIWLRVFHLKREVQFSFK